MKKKDFLAMVESQLASLGDDDEVLIECDGGEFWGNYNAHPKVVIEPVYHPEFGVPIGHPGDTSAPAYKVDAKMLAIFKEA
jgi:hypothetical protein